MRPIVRPGAPGWLHALSRAGSPAATITALIIAVTIVIATIAGYLAPLLIPLVVAAGVAGCIGSVRADKSNVVVGPLWQCNGRSIDGQGFQLLADIDSRFAYAESNIKTLPTGIVWSEVERDVRVLLWEAAEHGAELTALDAEIHEMRYAQEGTPQAALLHALEEQRKAHWDLMRGIQWEAETLARTAGNAAAAAHLALIRTGSLSTVSRLIPSRQALAAAGALADARERLELLAKVWAELDETGAIAAEKLDAEKLDAEKLDAERKPGQLGAG